MECHLHIVEGPIVPSRWPHHMDTGIVLEIRILLVLIHIYRMLLIVEI